MLIKEEPSNKASFVIESADEAAKKIDNRGEKVGNLTPKFIRSAAREPLPKLQSRSASPKVAKQVHWLKNKGSQHKLMFTTSPQTWKSKTKHL